MKGERGGKRGGTKTSFESQIGGVGGNGGSIVMGVHWNSQNTSKYITIHIVMYFDVFCVFQ